MLPRPLALLTLTLCAQGLIAQKTELPIGDLVRSPRLAPFEHEDEDERRHRPAWIHRQLPPGRESALVKGEGALLNDLKVRPWFTSNDLLEVLQALGTQTALDVDGTNLLVAKDGAASALSALNQLRRELPPRVLLDVKLERLGESPKVLFHTRQHARAGATVAFQDLVHTRKIRDFDVEIAQAATTSNPIVDTVSYGTCIAVRPRLIPGRDELLLEVFTRVGTAVPGIPIKAAAEDMYPIDRSARLLSESGVALRVPRGASRTIKWTGANGAQLRLTCSASSDPRQPAPNRNAAVRCYSLFHKGVAEFRSDVYEPDEGPPPLVSEATFRRAGVDDLDIVSGKGAATAVVVRSANMQKIDTAIGAQVSRKLPAADLEVLVYDVATGAEPAADGSKQLALVQSPVIVGKSVAFSGRTEMRFIRDWDVEVAQSARIADPKTDILRYGYHVDARVIAGVSGRLEAVALEGNVSRLADLKSRRAQLSTKMVSAAEPPEKGTRTPPVVLEAERVNIELPVIHEQRLTANLPLSAKGETTLRRSAPRLLGEGRELVIVVRVKK